MNWKLPPKIKIYEALGALADGRLEKDGDEIRVYSSTRSKYYNVWLGEPDEIMTNDNGSFWVGYLGYPALSYLMSIGDLPLEESYAQALSGIQWKDLNTQYKNDFDKVILEIENSMVEQGINIDKFHDYLDDVLRVLTEKSYTKFGKRKHPPTGY